MGRRRPRACGRRSAAPCPYVPARRRVIRLLSPSCACRACARAAALVSSPCLLRRIIASSPWRPHSAVAPVHLVAIDSPRSCGVSAGHRVARDRGAQRQGRRGAVHLESPDVQQRQAGSATRSASRTSAGSSSRSMGSATRIAIVVSATIVEWQERRLGQYEEAGRQDRVGTIMAEPLSRKRSDRVVPSSRICRRARKYC